MTTVRDRTSLSDSTSVNTFSRLVGLPTLENKHIRKYIGIWGNSYIQNELKDFIFKQRYNLLLLNNRLHAIYPEVDPTCTFCRIRRLNTRDSFEHSFVSCDVAQNLLLSICNALQPPFLINSVEFRQIFWYGLQNGKIDT